MTRELPYICTNRTRQSSCIIQVELCELNSVPLGRKTQY